MALTKRLAASIRNESDLSDIPVRIMFHTSSDRARFLGAFTGAASAVDFPSKGVVVAYRDLFSVLGISTQALSALLTRKTISEFLSSIDSRNASTTLEPFGEREVLSIMYPAVIQNLADSSLIRRFGIERIDLDEGIFIE